MIVLCMNIDSKSLQSVCEKKRKSSTPKAPHQNEDEGKKGQEGKKSLGGVNGRRRRRGPAVV
jgi:hypothetical protein